MSVSPCVTESAIVSSRAIGDLVIGFGTGAPTGGRTTQQPWTCSAPSPEWELWEQPPSPNWKGFPVAEIKIAGWQVWLLGKLYDNTGQADEVARAVTEVVLGRRPASSLNGHWLLWAWDENDRDWHLWTDRFGSLHAYHARSDGRAALGTSFGTVARLASRRRLDWHGIAGFFGFGFFPGDRTYYEDVKILRPATHYVFGAKGVEVRAQRYWDWRHEPDRNRSYEDTVEQFGEIFAVAMRDRLQKGRIALPISGGLDSRCTVAAINDEAADGRSKMEDGRFWSYSYGYSDDSVETRIAREVAEARGVPFKPFTIKPYLFNQIDQVLAAVEGFQDITQCRQAFVADELREHADFVIAAHWGDVWLDDMGLVGKGPRDHGTTGPQDRESVVSGQWSSGLVTEHALAKMVKKGRGWLLENVCGSHLGQEKPEDLLRQFVNEGMKPLQHIEDPDFRVKAFKTDNWSFRWTLASLRMFQAAAFPRLPFYDTRLADFFCTATSEYVAGRRLQVDYLKRFAPDLAGIEWQPHGADLYHYQDIDPLRLPKRAINKAWRVLTGEKVIERNWEVQFGGREGRANLDHWLTRPGLKLHEYLSPANTQSLVNDFYNRWPDPELGYTISMLLTFSAWLERFAT
jgi:asparagine synthase (glutamine-hydrolysing)